MFSRNGTWGGGYQFAENFQKSTAFELKNNIPPGSLWAYFAGAYNTVISFRALRRKDKI
jgi:hypothetical protein